MTVPVSNILRQKAKRLFDSASSTSGATGMQSVGVQDQGDDQPNRAVTITKMRNRASDATTSDFPTLGRT